MNNKYIEIFDEIYLSLICRGYTKRVETKEVYVKPKWMGRKEKVTVEVPFYEDMIHHKKQVVDNFIKENFGYRDRDTHRNFIRSFDDMCQFCDFVRYAEKVLFYQNTTANDLYVDSEIDSKIKLFSINVGYDTFIKFKLEKKSFHDIVGTDMNIIEIEVKRNFGKEMYNKFTIVNGEVKYNDTSDMRLMDSINILLYEKTLNTFKVIMEKVFEFFSPELYTRWEKDV